MRERSECVRERAGEREEREERKRKRDREREERETHREHVREKKKDRVIESEGVEKVMTIFDSFQT